MPSKQTIADASARRSRARVGRLAAAFRLAPLVLLVLGGCTTGKPGTIHRPYTVYAGSTLGFARSIHSNAPRGGRAYGLVEITFHPDYKLTPKAGGCEAEVKDVGLELVIILPKWRDGKPVPGSLRRQWQRFDRTIRAHEMKHVSIARSYASRMRKSIAAMRSKGGCGELSARILKRIAQLKAQHLRAHAHFDARERKRLKSLL